MIAALSSFVVDQLLSEFLQLIGYQRQLSRAEGDVLQILYGRSECAADRGIPERKRETSCVFVSACDGVSKRGLDQRGQCAKRCPKLKL